MKKDVLKTFDLLQVVWVEGKKKRSHERGLGLFLLFCDKHKSSFVGVMIIVGGTIFQDLTSFL